jgi:Fic family protein
MAEQKTGNQSFKTTIPVAYHLGKFPPKKIEWKELVPLIGPASAGLGCYDALLTAIPNVRVLLSPLIMQEAVLSSKIEGTHVTMGEVLELEAGGTSDKLTQTKRDDAEEVVNYRAAMNYCVDELSRRPFSQQILRSAHAMLMKGVRGRDKAPGAYRLDQNWIGPDRCPIEKASFVPIAPEHLQQGMDHWEKYFGDEKASLDALVQLAIIHVEFEALHPFKDGNGRLGRMLLPIFLFQRKILSTPDFYMSEYLEANRLEYQERLRGVSRNEDWTGWCAFFLRGISQQAKQNESRARLILNLYNRLKTDMPDYTHSQHCVRAVDFIFQTPIFTAPSFTNHSKIPKPTAARILSVMRKKKILIPLRKGMGRRAGIYAFRELLNIAEGKNVF